MDHYFYTVNDFGPLMKGMVIGDGIPLCYFQRLVITGRNALAHDLVDG